LGQPVFDSGRQPLIENRIENFRRHRLGDEGVHAGFEAMPPVLVKGVGGHRDNRHGRTARQAANRPGRLDAVHFRHLHVHQDQLVIAGAEHFHRFTPVDRNIGIQADGFEHVERHLAVDFVVLGEQQAGARAMLQQLAADRPAHCCRPHQRRRIARPQHGREPEHAALAGFADDANVAAHQLGQPPGDGQTEAGTAISAGG
jgi:hypothetical protein